MRTVLSDAAVRIREAVADGRVERRRQQPAPQAADPESRRLFRGEQHDLDRAPRSEARSLERANGLQATEHSDGAVEAAGVWNGVDVRAGRDRRQLWRRANPARERVAHGILAHREAGLRAKSLEVSASLEIRFAEHDTRHGGRRRVREPGERVQLVRQPRRIDMHRRYHLGCRSQSL